MATFLSSARKMLMDTFFYTCQLFLSYRHEIFILGVLGFSKTTQTYLKIPEDVVKLPKMSKFFQRGGYKKSALPRRTDNTEVSRQLPPYE